MTTYTLRGHLTLLSPLAISQPGTAPAKATEPQPPPVTTVYREGEGLVETVYLPSSSFRGPLRRAGTQEIFRVRKEAGLDAPFDLRTGYMLNIGGTRGRGASSLYYDVGAREALRDRNVQIAVFGAADTGDQTFISGRLGIDHAHPTQPIAVDACPVFPAMRSDDMLRAPEKMMDMLDAGAPAAWELLHQAATEASTLKKERKSTLAAAMKAKAEKDAPQQRALLDRVREIDLALDGGGQSIAMPLAGYRAIPAGTVLEHRIVLFSDRPAELGLLLAAIEAFAEDPYLGGHRAHGCGRFSARWTLEHRAQRQMRSLGEVRIDGEGAATIPTGPDVDAARTAFEAACKTGDFLYRAPTASGAGEAAE